MYIYIYLNMGAIDMANKFQNDDEPQDEKSMFISQDDYVQRQKEMQDYRYNPEHALHKVGYAQEKMLDAVMQMDMQELLFKPKIMENVTALMNNMNGTAVQVTRNAIVESNSNLGNLADAVIDRLEERGVNMIKTAKDSGRRGQIPEAVIIDDSAFEEIQEGMLIKGLVHTTYDEFADEHGLTQTQDEI